jgi:hypothetical protein
MVMLVEGSTVLTMDGRCADVSQLTMINVINEGREKKKKDTVCIPAPELANTWTSCS